ncbi:unnamed protein product [Cochlearia groenlandica]
MISDSITDASAIAAPTSKDFGKKKRNNKWAKMKQNKLDLRREQWLSQAAMMTKKVCKEEKRANFCKKPDQRDNTVGNLEEIRREIDNDGVKLNLHHESFMESTSNSSIGGTSFSERSSSRSSSSSSGFCSGNITEDEHADDDEDDDGCVDDWEAVADALAAEEENEKESAIRVSLKEQESVGQLASNVVSDSVSDPSGGCVRDAKRDCLRMSSRKQKSNRAWRPDDNLRPQGLPNLGKQLSFPELNKRFTSVTIPSSCPICYEDLDLTDSSFLPCPCGFRLCLFCHKTICEGDGRCPGCRKPYEQNMIKIETFRLGRSTSMFCTF